MKLKAAKRLALPKPPGYRIRFDKICENEDGVLSLESDSFPDVDHEPPMDFLKEAEDLWERFGRNAPPEYVNITFVVVHDNRPQPYPIIREYLLPKGPKDE